jgi:hypothetical protein
MERGWKKTARWLAWSVAKQMEMQGERELKGRGVAVAWYGNGW